jgi:hypothetical protein
LQKIILPKALLKRFERRSMEKTSELLLHLSFFFLPFALVSHTGTVFTCLLFYNGGEFTLS